MAVANILNLNFKNEVAAHPGGERVLNCFLCGTCTAGCPISTIAPEYNPRKIMRQILLGQRDEVLMGDEIWKCYQCHTCVAHCPQDVRFADVIRALREIAVNEKIVDEAFVKEINKIDLESRKAQINEVNKQLKKRNKSR